MTKISIIVPCYKRVEQTISTISLLLKSNGWGVNFEAEVIVTDCTENDSLKNAVKKEFGELVGYYRPKKQGVSANKNKGAEVAKNPILLFVDSDMEVEPNTINSCIDYLKKHPFVASITTNIIWRGGPNDGTFDRPKKEDRFLNCKETEFVEFIYSRFKMTYKKVFDLVGGYDEKVFNMRGEGSDLSTRYWRAGFPLAFNRDSAVHHREDAPDSVAIRVKHPEWGVAKDYLLLGYKYGNFEVENCDYFASTVAKNMTAYDSQKSHFRILQGIAKYYDLIASSKTY